MSELQGITETTTSRAAVEACEKMEKEVSQLVCLAVDYKRSYFFSHLSHIQPQASEAKKAKKTNEAQKEAAVAVGLPSGHVDDNNDDLDEEDKVELKKEGEKEDDENEVEGDEEDEDKRVQGSSQPKTEEGNYERLLDFLSV